MSDKAQPGRKMGECGRYNENYDSPNFGNWEKCGDFLEVRQGNDHPRFPTIYFKCSCCGKEGSL